MHNINSMMYYGQKPWHKIGTQVMEAATSEQAILLSFAGCHTQTEIKVLKDNTVFIQGAGGAATVTPVWIDGRKYIVLIGNGKFAICPAKDDVRL